MVSPSPPLSHTLKPLFSTAAARCESLLHRCATAVNPLSATKQLHAYITTSGLFSNHFLCLLTSAYALTGHTLHACKLFNELPDRKAIAYKGMIRMHTENKGPREALHLFVEMRQSGIWVDEHTYPFVIRACGDLLLLELGKVVHGLAIKAGALVTSFMGNSLIAMYMNCGDQNGAGKVFAAMEEKTIVSWNTMVSGWFRNGNAKEALMVFNSMVYNNVQIDSATVLSVLPACGYLKDLEAGRHVHSLVKGKSIHKRLAVQNAFIDMYVKCGSMEEARSVFDGMLERDVVTWTSVINGYICIADVKGALEMFRLMQAAGIQPNEVTVAALTGMCANTCNLKLGKTLHAWVIRHNVDCDVNVETALVDFYAKCDSVELSLRVFSTTSKKETVPWNAVLSGCVRNKMTREAINLFKRMRYEEVKPNEATWKSLLPAYAIEADLNQVTNVHSYLIQSGFARKPDILTGMIDVYSKCGCLQYARKLFDNLSIKNRDIVLWSVIISSYGKHGLGQEALTLFNHMVRSGIEPNEVTFTSVLHACGHAGLVDDGSNLFNFMVQNYPKILRMEHYTCMIDLLGRANRVKEAREVIDSMPFEANHSVWGALLGACVIHENVEVGEVAAGRLFELEPGNTGNYVLMGNIYSAVGRFGDAAKMRRLMSKIGLIKASANSMV